MEIYFYIYVALLFLALKEKKIIVNYKKPAFVFASLGVFLAIRYNVGNDYAEYTNVLNEITEGFYTTYFEYGFVFFYKIFHSPEVFFAVLSLLSIFLLYKGFKYFSTEYLYISILVYYSTFFVIFNIHLIRQSVAIFFVFGAYIFLHKKKYLQCILLILLASSFHKSAIIVFPFCFLISMSLTKNTRLIVLGIATLFYMIFTFFKTQVFGVLSFIPITHRFAVVYYNMTYSSGYGISVGLLFDIILFLFVNSRRNLSSKQAFLLNIFLCALFINIACNSFNVALRLGYYFRLVSVFLFVSLIKIKPKIFFYLFLIIYSSYYLYLNLYKGHAVLEYHTIFNK